MLFSNKVYTILKALAMIILPAIGSFYAAIATIWGLGYIEEVVGTIVAIDTLLGVILQISTTQFNKTGTDGTLQIDTSNPEKDLYLLNIKTLDNLAARKTIMLSIDPEAKLSQK